MVPFQQKSRAAILGHCWPSGKTRRQQRLGRQTNLPNPFRCCTAVFLWIAPSPDKLRRVTHAPESLLSTGKTNTLFTVHYSHSVTNPCLLYTSPSTTHPSSPSRRSRPTPPTSRTTSRTTSTVFPKTCKTFWRAWISSARLSA